MEYDENGFNENLLNEILKLVHYPMGKIPCRFQYFEKGFASLFRSSHRFTYNTVLVLSLSAFAFSDAQLILHITVPD